MLLQFPLDFSCHLSSKIASLSFIKKDKGYYHEP